MLAYSKLDPLTQRGSLIDTSLDGDALEDECPSDSHVTGEAQTFIWNTMKLFISAVLNFRYAKQLVATFGRDNIEKQKEHAKTIVKNIQHEFVHRLMTSDLSTPTKDVMVSAGTLHFMLCVLRFCQNHVQSGWMNFEKFSQKHALYTRLAQPLLGWIMELDHVQSNEANGEGILRYPVISVSVQHNERLVRWNLSICPKLITRVGRLHSVTQSSCINQCWCRQCLITNVQTKNT